MQTGVLHDASDTERAALELLQAISVAAAYYEDSLSVAPETILVAGALDPTALDPMLENTGMRARSVLQAADLQTTTAAPGGLLAGLRGALKT